MSRRILSVLVAAVLAAGCAGPNKLAEKSQQKLSDGDVWKAWRLATRALDREPMNPRAKQAAAATYRVIADDWQQRIRSLGSVDSLRAAEQVLEYSDFRSNAVRYVNVAVPAEWAAEERVIRGSAARHHYRQGKLAASRASTSASATSRGSRTHSSSRRRPTTARSRASSWCRSRAAARASRAAR